MLPTGRCQGPRPQWGASRIPLSGGSVGMQDYQMPSRPPHPHPTAQATLGLGKVDVVEAGRGAGNAGQPSSRRATVPPSS